MEESVAPKRPALHFGEWLSRWTERKMGSEGAGKGWMEGKRSIKRPKESDSADRELSRVEVTESQVRKSDPWVTE